jgi:hypothetical protein
MRVAVVSTIVLAALSIGCAKDGAREQLAVTQSTPGPSSQPSAQPSTEPSALHDPASVPLPNAEVRFTTRVLSNDFYAESAAIGDIDGDGVVDLIAGPLWFRGPEFEVLGQLAEAPTFDLDHYSSFFLSFGGDLDDDGDLDVIAIDHPGGPNGNGAPNARWYDNPGPAGLNSEWPVHQLFDAVVGNESPTFANLLPGDAKQLVFMTDGKLGYALPSLPPSEPWQFTPISGQQFSTPYVHGLGIAEVTGDGRADVLEATGYWEQPTSLEQAWTHHAIDFAEGGMGGAQMYGFDVDGDGDTDVLSSLNAHGYGLAWFEQISADEFVAHEILPSQATAESFSQQHAMVVADINGDGLLDIVTGKRYYAHPSATPDPGTTDPAVVYWFELVREGGVQFVPHLIHSDSGVGCSFAVGDVTGDGRPDVFTANKHGIFLHVQD